MNILIIDDDDVDRTAARRALQKAGIDIEITEVASSIEALESMRTERFDCALMDYELPDTDGLTLLQRLRREHVDVPIICLTGHGDELIAVEVMKAGASDYLSKTRLTADALARAVRTAVRLHGAERQTRQSEERRRESEDRFRVMADSAPVLIWVSGLDGNTNYFNEGWLKFRGHTHEQEASQGATQGIHPDDRVRSVEIYRTAFAAHSKFSMEYRLQRADGVYRWMFDTGQPRFLPDGSFAGYIGSCIDITERKQVEEALVRNQTHIATLNNDLRQTVSLMHDRVRNTLQTLNAMVDLLTFRSADTVPADDVRQLGVHIHIMSAVHDLLMKQAKADGKAAFLSARAVLDRLFPLFDSMSRRCKLETEIEEILIVSGQGFALPIITNEILSNAYKHGCRPGGSVRMSLRREENEAVLVICDDGPGFPPGFDPEQSAHNGIELVNSLARWDLGGTTKFENAPKGGACVTLRFPVPPDTRKSSV